MLCDAYTSDCIIIVLSFFSPPLHSTSPHSTTQHGWQILFCFCACWCVTLLQVGSTLPVCSSRVCIFNAGVWPGEDWRRQQIVLGSGAFVCFLFCVHVCTLFFYTLLSMQTVLYTTPSCLEGPKVVCECSLCVYPASADTRECSGVFYDVWNCVAKL